MTPMSRAAIALSLAVLAGNHPNGSGECGLIGPLPVGCGTVAVEERTWGAVKALYR